MRTKIGIMLVGILGLAVIVGLSWAQSVPQLINYQGRLTNTAGQPPVDGSTVDMTFAFWNSSADIPTTILYLTVFQKNVVVTKGLYNVLIGSGTITPVTESTLAAVFQKHNDVWMGVMVDAGPEMTPRSRIASVPYALSVDLGAIYTMAAADPDHDHDGYLSPLVGGNDCNDNNDMINPGISEQCYDGVDNDCNGLIDSNDPACCTDADNDLFFLQTGCGIEEDCNDHDPAVYPNAPELCDGIDNQCPGDLGYGEIDEGCMALIPAGCFNMGDAFAEGSPDELPVHNVCITAPFYLDYHQVTNEQYAACVSASACTPPSHTDSSTRASYYGNPTYSDFPVIHVDWNQATAYCAWAGKHLPTEAQWEYAARGGLSGKRYPWGDSISGTNANYFDSGDPWDNDTSRVKYYAVNGFGLYDMVGNTYEWVNDWYSFTYYSTRPNPDNNPTGPASGTERVNRGGSWSFGTGYMRVALRSSYQPIYGLSDQSFRCAKD